MPLLGGWGSFLPPIYLVAEPPALALTALFHSPSLVYFCCCSIHCLCSSFNPSARNSGYRKPARRLRSLNSLDSFDNLGVPRARLVLSLPFLILALSGHFRHKPCRFYINRFFPAQFFPLPQGYAASPLDEHSIPVISHATARLWSVCCFGPGGRYAAN